MGIKGIPKRSQLKKPTWIIILVSLVCVFLVFGYVYPPRDSVACHVFSSSSCKKISSWLPSLERELSDEEIASRVVIKNLLKTPSTKIKNPKIAFMFLSPGSLAFERLWDKFFKGHEGRFSIHIHASRVKPVHSSRYFQNQEIRSDKVFLLIEWRAKIKGIRVTFTYDANHDSTHDVNHHVNNDLNHDPIHDSFNYPTLGSNVDPTHEPNHDPNHDPTQDLIHKPNHDPIHETLHDRTMR
ncbi:hypothetical protein R6Q57_018553 [Mikania cordata]